MKRRKREMCKETQIASLIHTVYRFIVTNCTNNVLLLLIQGRESSSFVVVFYSAFTGFSDFSDDADVVFMLS